MVVSIKAAFLVVAIVLVLLPSHAHAFGAGSMFFGREDGGCVKADASTDIASISELEGRAFRHGDIEDVLKTLVCIKGHQWTSMMMKRVYFG